MTKENNKIIYRESAFRYVKKLQKSKFDLLAVYILGSLIMRDFSKFSDIDIAVTSNDLTYYPVNNSVNLMK